MAMSMIYGNCNELKQRKFNSDVHFPLFETAFVKGGGIELAAK
jgi:hypothetical protein